MNNYRALTKQVYTSGEHAIVPIRMEDRYAIMDWRNQQMYHLRQNKPLTRDEQDNYFENIVKKLFEQEHPSQLLFSYLQENSCIGYGGLVHINWVDKNAEISFIINTSLEETSFHEHWRIYLNLISEVAFKELKLHKIYTYAFDLRPQLYAAVESSGFVKEAILKEHCLFDGMYRDVVIHSKINTTSYPI